MANYPTLILTPNFDVQEQYPDHTLEITLGDGYTYNSVSTNQPTRAEWSIRRNGLGKADVDELVDQLSVWGSVTPFYWQPHSGVQRKLYFCENWTVTPIGFKHYEFSATFIEDIRGECVSLGALIDPDDIDSKLSNASDFLTTFTGNGGNYLIRSTNNLVCRTLHTHAEQIPSTHGTLYDQLTLALSCIAAYEYNELTIWLTRAIAYANAIIVSYYNSAPEAGIYLPHWLFDIKGDARLEEIYPTVGTLSSGVVNAPFAYVPMLWELYTKLAEHDSTESKWGTLANSSK
jgi:phage-related protein